MICDVIFHHNRVNDKSPKKGRLLLAGGKPSTMSRLMVPKRAVECGRKTLIGWVNKQLSLNLPDLNCLADGSVYCFLVNKLQTNIIPRKKIRENPTSMGYLHNYKLLQDAFFALGVNKIIPVEQLMAHNSRALQIFTCWFKCFFELNYSTPNRTIKPFDLDNLMHRYERRSHDLKLCNLPKKKEEFHRKERVKRRKKTTSLQVPTEKGRCRLEKVEKALVAEANEKRGECFQRETWDKQSDTTYRAESVEELYRLSDLSLATTEKDTYNETELNTCSYSSAREVQPDETAEQRKQGPKKITKENLRSKSKTFKKATKVSSETNLRSKCKTNHNFESDTSSAGLPKGRFTGQEPGTFTILQSSSGPLNEGQLLKEILAEQQIEENQETLSESLTEVESKLSESLFDDQTETNDQITKSFSESLDENEEESISDNLEPEVLDMSSMNMVLDEKRPNNFEGGYYREISDSILDEHSESYVEESPNSSTIKDEESYHTGSDEDEDSKENHPDLIDRDSENLSKDTSNKNRVEDCDNRYSTEKDEIDSVDMIFAESETGTQNDSVDCQPVEVWQENINPESCHKELHISDETNQLTVQELENNFASDQDCWSPDFLKLLAECIANGRKYNLVLFDDRYIVSPDSDLDPNEIGDSVAVLPVLESSSDSGEQDDELSYIDGSKNVELTFVAEDHVECQT